jgi:hypothetical protein
MLLLLLQLCLSQWVLAVLNAAAAAACRVI